jgi:hypothetical protein
MKTLVDILTGGLVYDNSWDIYAERIDGEFRPESPARIGQRRFKNGGVKKGNFKFFTNSKRAIELIDFFLEGLDPDEIGEIELKEAALDLIDHINALVRD